jgi:hypothetical protein
MLRRCRFVASANSAPRGLKLPVGNPVSILRYACAFDCDREGAFTSGVTAKCFRRSFCASRMVESSGEMDRNRDRADIVRMLSRSNEMIYCSGGRGQSYFTGSTNTAVP